MRATGLKKGGIYNHFDSKGELARAAFEYAYQQLRRRFDRVLADADDDPAQQLLGLIHVYSDVIQQPPVAGGCPILNTAIESDDAHPTCANAPNGR